jgi:diketogulonate reductase-like aldo/keto reductase
MQTVTSAAGVHMPNLLYGTAWKQDKTAALVERALSLGFVGIDTACQPKHYAEGGVGAGIAAALKRGLSREALYLQTKFTPVGGQDPRRIPYDAKAPLAEQVRQSAQASLANLQTSYLDCLILHSPISPVSKMLEAWQAMQELVDAGVVKALGISNCYELPVLMALWHGARIKPRVVQNRFYEKTHFDREIRAFCTDNGLRYQSFWTLTANPQLLAHPSLLALASRYSVTAAQTLFRCLTQIGISVLCGTTSELHMRQCVAIFDFELTEPELRRLVALFS